MFTGIVEGTGTVRAAGKAGEKVLLRVDLGPLVRGLGAGDSVSVAGVCLTLAGKPRGRVGTFEVVRETLDRTTLGGHRPGDRVNLERALRVGDRLGGHFVQGHVDGVGRVRGAGGPPGAFLLSVSAPSAVMENLIRKGSVAVDGVSLTVASLDRKGFTVALVPHTLEVTTLGDLRRRSRVNLEADLLGKWVRRILADAVPGAAPPRITRSLLEEQGFGG